MDEVSSNSPSDCPIFMENVLQFFELQGKRWTDRYNKTRRPFLSAFVTKEMKYFLSRLKFSAAL
jgi:hypothetical protein